MRSPATVILLLGFLGACRSVQPEPAPHPPLAAETPGRGLVGASIETLGAG